MDKLFELNRGDVVYADLGQHPKSSVQSGRRPCLIISSSKDNLVYSNPVVTICPCTTRYEENRKEYHILLTKKDVDGYLAKASLIMTEQVMTVDKRQILMKISHVTNENVLKKVSAALQGRLGLRDTEGAEVFDK